MAQKKRPVTKSGRPRARKGVKLQPTQLTPPQLALGERPPEVAALAEQVEADGGAVLAAYREPLGGHALLFVALPLDKVDRTPFQRDVSDAHVRRLTLAMDKTKRYLDPIIAVRQGDRYLTPNGGHRLTALQELGARSVLALLVPEREVAYQILALNIEKAHNLREKALEVVRMYRDLAGSVDPKEQDMALEFEEAALVTLGFAYEERPRLSLEMNACLPGSVWNATPRSLSPLERNTGFWTPAYMRSIGPAVTREQSPAFLRNSNGRLDLPGPTQEDRKSTRLNSSHQKISYAVFCLKKKKERA